MINFRIIGSKTHLKKPLPNTVYLHIDHWNDYSFFTLFRARLVDSELKIHELGMVKIGFKGQKTEVLTRETLKDQFPALPDGYFSLGADVDYYHSISQLRTDIANEYLSSIKDVVFNEKILEDALNEEVFKTSLLRGVSLNTIKNQFLDILKGRNSRTAHEFVYNRPESHNTAALELYIKVKPDSTPSTNIHALIGRNGVGKTRILNGILEALTTNDRSCGAIEEIVDSGNRLPIPKDYFGRLVSVSYSLFDPFTPPKEQPDPSKGLCYFYIGFKVPGKENQLKSLEDIHQEILDALDACFSEEGRRERWIDAIKILESDSFFSEIRLSELERTTTSDLQRQARSIINNMSSGHTIILHTITNLVAKVESNTLVIIDEPESHLHPPLLAAFVRALSQLLRTRNGLAIIATHSPVVLQEVPSSCVSVIHRAGDEMAVERPSLETFGENVGILTKEVFGLEVLRSGFHKILDESVKLDKSYKEIISEYHNQLGSEARASLQSLIINRKKIQ